MQSIIAPDPYTRCNKLHKITVTDSRQSHSHKTQSSIKNVSWRTTGTKCFLKAKQI